jgi:hypothetical protein
MLNQGVTQTYLILNNSRKKTFITNAIIVRKRNDVTPIRLKPISLKEFRHRKKKGGGSDYIIANHHQASEYGG